jgi:TonB family protein
MRLLFYILEVSILQMLFYLIFFFLLKRLSWFSANRVYLLFTLLASLLIPFIEITIPTSTPLSNSIFQIREVVVNSNLAKTKAGSIGLDFIIYTAGLISIGSYFLWYLNQLWQIRKLFTNAIIRRKKRFVLVETKQNHAFSFFNYIFLNQTISGSERKKIILHEKAHIQQWHTIDLLFIDIILACQWFNPFAWQYRKAIIENHEFLADVSTLRQGVNQLKYQQLLLNQLFKSNQVQFVTYFNQSLIKKRIFMMTKDTNKKTERIRFFLAIPLATMIIVCFSFKASLPEQILAPMTANRHMAADFSSTQDVQKDSLKKGNLQKNKSRQVFIVVEKNASFQDGDLETFRAWVLQNLKYPESAAKKGIQGKVILSFIVETDGSVTEVKVLRAVDPSLDEEAVRTIKSSPAWVPGRQAGKSVAQQFTMPIAFKLSK